MEWLIMENLRRDESFIAVIFEGVASLVSWARSLDLYITMDGGIQQSIQYGGGLVSVSGVNVPRAKNAKTFVFFILIRFPSLRLFRVLLSCEILSWLLPSTPRHILPHALEF